MDLSMISDILSSINPLFLGGGFGGLLLVGGTAFLIKRKKSNKKSNVDFTGQSNEFKTLSTEDLEREFGSLTVQTKLLDEYEDESLFVNNDESSHKDKSNDSSFPSAKFVDEAIVFDGFNKSEQALKSLKKAFEIETHDKEKVRLKILVSQYNNKKGRVPLDKIIEEYPSFHKQTQNFDPNNTISALMSSPLPKADMKADSSKNPFDMFADIPVLTEIIKTEPKKEKNKSSTDIFADLPDVQTPVVHKQEKETKKSLFDDLPSLDEVPKKEDSSPKGQFDQFSLDNSETKAKAKIEDETEKMLKSLQNDADSVDQANDKQDAEDTQKFWQEFGKIVVDIKQEVTDNRTLTKPEPEITKPVSPVLPTVEKIIPVASTPATKPQFKVWANWIIHMEGQQVYRNHFVNLKSPWGSSAAAEELYMGIAKFCGKDLAGKTYPWVLVSVFPINQ